MLNVAVGKLELLHISYMYDCQSQTFVPTSERISPAVDDIGRSLVAKTKFLYILLFDSTRYKIAVGTTSFLKSLYHKFFHVICAAHLLHDSATTWQVFFDLKTKRTKVKIQKN